MAASKPGEFRLLMKWKLAEAGLEPSKVLDDRVKAFGKRLPQSLHYVFNELLLEGWNPALIGTALLNAGVEEKLVYQVWVEFMGDVQTEVDLYVLAGDQWAQQDFPLEQIENLAAGIRRKYREMVERGASRRERIEELASIMDMFGEDETESGYMSANYIFFKAGLPPDEIVEALRPWSGS